MNIAYATLMGLECYHKYKDLIALFDIIYSLQYSTDIELIM